MRHIRLMSVLITVLICCYQQQAKAQADPLISNFKERKNAAIAELKNFPNEDTNRVNALMKIVYTAAFLKERQEVLQYRIEAMALSQRLNYIKGIAYCYSTTGNYYKSASNYIEALHYYDSALNITLNTKHPDLLDLRSRVFRQAGMVRYEQGNYYASLDNFFESLKYAESRSPDQTMAMYSFIVDIYIILNNLEKATEFAKRNIAMAEADTSDKLRGNVYFSFMEVCFAKKDYQTVALYLDKMKPFMPDPKEVQVNYGYYLKRGTLSYLRENYNEANKNYQEAYKYAIMGGHKKSRIESLRCLSTTALKLGDHESAKKYALENMAQAEQINTKAEKIAALTNLADYYNVVGNKNKSVELLQEALQLKDSAIAEMNIKQINILSAIYDAEQQNKQIAQLQNEKEKQDIEVKQQSVLNWLFIVSIVVLLILGYLGYTNFRKGQQLAKNQQALQRQKIIQLEKDKQLLIVDAMLKGQEEERSRIAKDLHDGLGSMLSGTKLSFINIKESLLLSPDNIVMFDKSLSMLDNTIGDLRKVAQNLMPEALVKFGVGEALRDFCEYIQSTSGLEVVYQHFGEERKIDSTASVFIYRIIQELVNNVIKHAEATQLIVQLVTGNEKITITVEDNGKGFDAGYLTKTKGMGMANIRYRIQYFNGTFDIVTAPGKGTSVNIELIV